MKRSHKITVAGSKYEWRAGNETTVIRRADASVLAKVFNHVLVGVSPDAHGRGKRKGSSDGSVRPLHIRQFIEGGGRAPRFMHDCATCRFVGSSDNHDFYYCARAEADMGGRKGEPLPEYGDHRTLDMFIEDCESGMFTDDDGYGRYASATEMFSKTVCPSDILDARINREFTHVVWFNK